jgi:hypothetical protein
VNSADDQITDPIHPDTIVPALHAFTRQRRGALLVGTLPVYHEGLPIPEQVVRSCLHRLDIELEDLLSDEP